MVVRRWPFGGTTSINANAGVTTLSGMGTFTNTANGVMTNIANSIDISCVASNSGTMMNTWAAERRSMSKTRLRISGSIRRPTPASGRGGHISRNFDCATGKLTGGLVVVYGTLKRQ